MTIRSLYWPPNVQNTLTRPQVFLPKARSVSAPQAAASDCPARTEYTSSWGTGSWVESRVDHLIDFVIVRTLFDDQN
jgi:hypothetical protein